jgi:SAM-dependent methyltransferase
MKTQISSRKKEWFDDDSFWKGTYPYMFPDAKFINAESEIKKILKLVKPKGKSVLDLCCGPGRCSVPFAKRGYDVTGVDLSLFLLNKAKSFTRKSKVNIEWIQSDMRDFIRPYAFDLVISMFTSFGYFEDKQEDILVLKNIFTNLKPGGSLLMDMGSKERLARIFQSIVTATWPDGTITINKHKILDNFTRIQNKWIIIREGKTSEFEFVDTIYSGQEIIDRLEIAGFKNIRLFGSLDGDEYGLNARRLIVVAQKPK